MSLFREHEGSQQYFGFYDQLFDAPGASPEMREKVNRGNAIKLFGLD